MPLRPPPDLALVQRLLDAGLQPTRQRLALAALVLAQPWHFTAEEALKRLLAQEGRAPTAIKPGVKKRRPGGASRATVYAALALFSRAGLLRELHTGSGAVVYDSNPSLHPHWVDVDTGQVHDLPPQVALGVTGLDALPADLHIEDVQVMLRVRRRPAAV